MMATPRCDLCRNEATYHEGTFHYCEKHKPIWVGGQEQPPTEQLKRPGLGAFDKDWSGLNIERRKRR